MRIFVTGGAGFVGSNLVSKLIEDGNEVMIFDNLSTGKSSNIHADSLFYEGSIMDQMDLGRAMVKFNPEVVYHLATSAGVRSDIFPSLTHANLGFIGSINVFDVSIEFGVEKVVFASSGGTVYGEALAQIPINERHPLAISAYGVAKVAVEMYLAHLGHVHKLPSTILRFCNMYGPGMPGGMFAASTFLDLLQCGEPPTIFGDGSSVRDYLYIEDAVEALRLAVHVTNGGIFNVGTGVGTSVGELFEMCQLLAQRHDTMPIWSDHRSEEVHYNVLDCEKIKGVLGWDSAVSFKDGLRICFDARRID